MLRLHDYPLSGNCYKVRLLLSLLGVDCERVPVDFFPGREHRTPRFLALNPAGQIPVLEHDDLVRLRLLLAARGRKVSLRRLRSSIEAQLWVAPDSGRLELR